MGPRMGEMPAHLRPAILDIEILDARANTRESRSNLAPNSE